MKRYTRYHALGDARIHIMVHGTTNTTNPIEDPVDVGEAAAEEGGAEHEEEVGEDGAGQRPLHYLDLVIVQREQSDDQLRRVPARRVQQPTHCKHNVMVRHQHHHHQPKVHKAMGVRKAGGWRRQVPVGPV